MLPEEPHGRLRGIPSRGQQQFRKRKGVRIVRYSKPEITSVMQAQAAIQRSSDKAFPMYVDANPLLGNSATSPAYEADE